MTIQKLVPTAEKPEMPLKHYKRSKQLKVNIATNPDKEPLPSPPTFGILTAPELPKFRSYEDVPSSLDAVVGENPDRKRNILLFIFGRRNSGSYQVN